MHTITKDEHDELVLLNEEFTHSDSMTVEMFEQRREAIELKYAALHNEQQIVPPVAGAAGTSPHFYKSLAAEFARFIKNFVAQKLKPLADTQAEFDKRVTALESGGPQSKFALPIYESGKLVGSQTLSAAELVREVTMLRAGKTSGDFPYAGVWNEATESQAGRFYTHNGSLWHCNADTRDRPGTSPAFTLAVKRGESEKLRV